MCTIKYTVRTAMQCLLNTAKLDFLAVSDTESHLAVGRCSNPQQLTVFARLKGHRKDIPQVKYWGTRPFQAAELSPAQRLRCCSRLFRCNPWPHVAIRHHHAQPAPVCRRPTRQRHTSVTVTDTFQNSLRFLIL